MAPTFWPTVLVLLAITCLVIGLPGLIQGGQVAKERGRDALMHYPASIGWLKGKVTAARWVQWVGRLYVIAAMCLTTLAFSLGLQSTAGVNLKNCEVFSSAILNLEWAQKNWYASPVDHQVNGCHSLILSPNGTRWFSIRSSSPDGLIGEGYRHQTREMERSGMALKPVSKLGQRAIIATSRTEGLANPTLIVEDSSGIHRIEMNGLSVDTAQRLTVIDAIRQTLADIQPQGM